MGRPPTIDSALNTFFQSDFSLLVQNGQYRTRAKFCVACVAVACWTGVIFYVFQANRGESKASHFFALLPSRATRLFTITAEIHARSLPNFHCQYTDRKMNLKFTRRVSERERAIRQFGYRKKQIDVSF